MHGILDLESLTTALDRYLKMWEKTNPIATPWPYRYKSTLHGTALSISQSSTFALSSVDSFLPSRNSPPEKKFKKLLKQEQRLALLLTTLTFYGQDVHLRRVAKWLILRF
ncbi:hypothetical protein M413DRAFT_116565 [Hebeloma cylindrosporum]|uniref:Uncharacterized protein n=1 Tax=Hebeloma cylindrosporum TaxID=76867 RepID=A0A0C2YJ69_HEBCY|nr:hypothetical protein M413DRAFT_116565 [Hebeloma cylindrosporum h7]